MATFTWYGYISAAWTDLAANTIIFGGSSFGSNIDVDSWQDSTHAGNGDPGSDQGTMNNVKYLTGSTMSVNGGGSENINDTNLATTECTLKVNFSHGSSVAITGARFYSYDGSVVGNEAVGVGVYAFERGVSASAWTHINSDSGNIGGDNSGERLALADQGAGTSHDYYIAASASPESVGAKTSFDFGVALTYS
jgi:hypothetical protein